MFYKDFTFCCLLRIPPGGRPPPQWPFIATINTVINFSQYGKYSSGVWGPFKFYISWDWDIVFTTETSHTYIHTGYHDVNVTTKIELSKDNIQNTPSPMLTDKLKYDGHLSFFLIPISVFLLQNANRSYFLDVNYFIRLQCCH